VRYGLLFLMIAGCLAFLPIGLQGAGWLILWLITAFALVGFAYLFGSAKPFGKRPDGSINTVSVVVLLPYLLYLWACWHVVRIARRKRSSCDQLTPSLWIGRRLLDVEYPSEVTAVVDLTCEFLEPRCIRRSKQYRACPILDGCNAPVDVVLALADHILTTPGITYLHCAEGYGRTGMVAAVVLLQQGLATTAEDAIAQVRAARPKVTMTGPQRRVVEQAAEVLREER